MTLEELIQKNQGQSLPVSDDTSKKELKNLNKSIQELIGSFKKDKESGTSDSVNKRMRDMIEKTVSQKPTGVKPMASRLITRDTKATKKEESTSKDKLVENVSKTNISLLSEIRNMRLELSKLKDRLVGPQQQQKMLAGGVDPNLDAVQRRDRGMLEGTGGGGGGSLLGGLLGGGAAAAAVYAMLTDEDKEKLQQGIKKLFDQMVNSPIGAAVKEAQKTAQEAITKWWDENSEKLMSNPIEWAKENPGTAAALGIGALTLAGPVLGAVGLGLGAAGLGLGAAGFGLGALKLGKNVLVGGAKLLKRGYDKPAELGTATGKMIRERLDARKEKLGDRIKKPLPGADVDADGKPKRIEPTMGKEEKPKVTAEQKPSQQVIETEEQKRAREKAAQKAKDDAKAMGEEDTAKRKRKVGIDDIETKKKPTFLDKLKSGGKKALKGARFLGPLGAVVGATMTAYDTAQAASNAEGVLGIEGREATFGEKLAAGVGGFTESVTLGLVNKEDVAKKLAGQQEQTKVSKDKVANAIDKKAKDAKREREINKQISGKKIEMQMLLNRGKRDEAMAKAREVVSLQDELKKVRSVPQEQRSYQPTTMLNQVSGENKQLTLPSPNMAASPYQGMMQNINNVFNSSNQTMITGGTAGPKNNNSSIARYLDRLFAPS